MVNPLPAPPRESRASADTAEGGASGRAPAAAASGGAAFSPLYRQIKDLLLQSLERGEWKPGEAIPSELELAARFQVSQGTVRKAIDELAADNVLLRRQGKGTFVATHHEAKVRYRFLRLAPDEGGEPAPAESRILECRRVRAPQDVARSLEIRPGDSAVLIRRLLSFGGVPTVLDEIWLPGVLFRGLTQERLMRNQGPLYAFFETGFGVSMIRADEKLRAVPAAADVAEILQVATGAPLMQVDRVSYTYGERPVEVRRGLYRTDRHHYRTRVN
ncbi:GntR family transcriptional regulator [Verticiella sediminum]|uniref:GntR family transcriptional regulator n=2 Tax=Verticiella sediminum TaxID=1247510 RepID=A0A556AD39_9BURK|nr:GntR family transcriptional regulator [Verticiella sediminum]TSH90797.1 GntR family transcriptional regulator [Verticiella sediminum]